MSTLTTYPASCTDRNSNTPISTPSPHMTSASMQPAAMPELPSSIMANIVGVKEVKTSSTVAQRKVVHMPVMKELASMRSYLPRIILARQNIKDPYPFPCSLNLNASYINDLPLRERLGEMRRKQENENRECIENTYGNSDIPIEQFYSVFWYMHLNSELESDESQSRKPSHTLLFEDKIKNNLLSASIEAAAGSKVDASSEVGARGNKLYISNAFRDTVDCLYFKTYAWPIYRNCLLPKPIELLFLFLKKPKVSDCLSLDDLIYALLHIFETKLSSIQKEIMYTEEPEDVSKLVDELFKHLCTKEGDIRFFKQQLQDFMQVKVFEFQRHTEKSKIDHFKFESRFVYDMIEANLPEFDFPEEFKKWIDLDFDQDLDPNLKNCCVIL